MCSVEALGQNLSRVRFEEIDDSEHGNVFEKFGTKQSRTMEKYNNKRRTWSGMRNFLME